MKISLLFTLISISYLSCARSNNKIEALCGDGIYESDNEECDTNDFGSITCIELGYYGGTIACTEQCKLDLSDCEITGRCGDSILHKMYGEQCDTNELGGETCSSIGLGSGTLACDNDCHFDTEGCELQAVCGDEVINGSEECDGGNINGNTCVSLGYYGGVLSCGSDCYFDTSLCEGRCGDSSIDPSEQCDSANLNGETCESNNYYGGNLQCSSTCNFDFSDCENFGICGDSVLQSNHEDCDGTVFNASCDDIQGFYGGTLLCSSDCSFDTSQCGFCGDNIIQTPYEECDNNLMGGANCLQADSWYGTVSCAGCSLSNSNCKKTRQFGTTADDRSVQLNFDSAGNMFLTGGSGGTFDGNSNTGGTDAILMKFTPDGNKGWSKLFGSTDEDTSFDTVFDSAGNLYVTGRTSGNLFGESTAGGTDAFIAKFNSSGALIWGHILGTNANDIARNIVIDSVGDVIIAGSTGGAFPGWPSNGGDDMFAAKYNPSGTRIWLKQTGTSGSDVCMGLGISSSDDIYLSGTTTGNMGGTSSGGSDNVLIKLNSFGLDVWAKQWGTSAEDNVFGMKTDSSGNSFVVGTTAGNLDGNSFVGVSDIFLTKFNSSGTKLWTKEWGSTGNDIGWGVTLDTTGNIYVYGLVEGSVGSVSSIGLYDTILTKFNPSGVKQWDRIYGTTGDDYGLSVEFSPSGELFVTGWTKGAFDGESYFGGWDLFIMRVPNI